ncbi:dTMP kinase [Amphibiibacter pelophylacis]|uniref:dTMP kinase n=1 Tax=Amphibiibacter pelophylacis TaxID=1799477 RepID=A0ACC6P3V7_9BURK
MSAAPRGRFISLEGIDGAGKSSHLGAISRWLQDQGEDVVQTREPGGTPLAETLRDLLLNREMDGLTEALLVFAGRRDHWRTRIAPALAQGRCVVSDRFADATFAYQGAGRGFDWSALQTLESWVLDGGPGPDLTLWFDVDPATAARRRAAARASDRLEALDEAFFARVRDGYARRAAENPQRVVRIDAGQPLDGVGTQVLQALQAWWPGRAR